MLELESVTLGPDLDTLEELSMFKEQLLNSCLTRFTGRDPVTREAPRTPAGRLRNIVTIDLFNHEAYIMATVLDPRTRLLPFDGI